MPINQVVILRKMAENDEFLRVLQFCQFLCSFLSFDIQANAKCLTQLGLLMKSSGGKSINKVRRINELDIILRRRRYSFVFQGVPVLLEIILNFDLSKFGNLRSKKIAPRLSSTVITQCYYFFISSQSIWLVFSFRVNIMTDIRRFIR